jgi:hypothetical protein
MIPANDIRNALCKGGIRGVTGDTTQRHETHVRGERYSILV